jgi:hypothetical protein
MQFEHLRKLSHDGPLTLTINGLCMGDNLPDGSQATIIRKTFYWPGDIVVLSRSSHQLFSHRFLGYLPGRTGWKAITMADSETLPDAPAPVGRMLGKVVRVNGESTRFPAWYRLTALMSFFRVIPGIIYTSLFKQG